MCTKRTRTTSKRRTIFFNNEGKVILSALATQMLNVQTGAQLFIVVKNNEKIFVGNKSLKENDSILCAQYAIRLHHDYIHTRLVGKARPLARRVLNVLNVAKSATLLIKVSTTNIGCTPFNEVILDRSLLN